MNDKNNNLTIAHKKDPEQKEKQKQQLLDLIPGDENTKVILPLQFFKKLDDEHFKMLIDMDDLEIGIGRKTERYIKKRMIRMGIRHQDHIQKMEQQ